MKTTFLTFTKKAKEKYPFQLLNFCIMDNHIHLLIKPAPGQSLSKIMQWIKGNFAKYWNKVHNKQGDISGESSFSQRLSMMSGIFCGYLTILIRILSVPV
ncbi:MAG: transposase [Treponema sp.]|nr:transposase [Treponema sp.]